MITEHTNEDTLKDSRLESASKIISSACAWSAAAALIPMPVVDLAALAAVQVNMVNEIAKLYDQTFEKDFIHSTISVLLGTLVPGSFSSGLKALPGFGTILGSATFGAFAAASTYALAKVIIRHFENGGTAASFDVKSVSADLKREFSAAAKSSAT